MNRVMVKSGWGWRVRPNVERIASGGQSRPASAGFTLIELLVSIALVLVVLVVASIVFLGSRQSFTTNDNASQLQDSARFATYILRRLAEQAGFQNYTTLDPSGNPVIVTRVTDQLLAQVPPGTPVCAIADICGFNNRRMRVTEVAAGSAGSSGSFTDASGNPVTTDTLVIRFQGASLPTDNTKPDGSMINCAGIAQSSPLSSALAERSVSTLYVSPGTTGEPELTCSYLGTGGGAATVPLIRGVESFHVLYGIDNNADSVADQFVRADQITTLNQWQQVRAVRFGMIIRGPVGSAPPLAGPLTLCPLGQTAGGACVDTTTTFNVPNDTRMRRVVNFTVYLRNLQG
jgi:type IV pilus assembly protein PilW